jgi:hypothetical protein
LTRDCHPALVCHQEIDGGVRPATSIGGTRTTARLNCHRNFKPLVFRQFQPGVDTTAIPGIGDAIAAVITKLYETGQHAKLEAMREKAPEGVLSMLRIPGLKPDRVRKLYADLGIASVEELEEAARSGRLITVKGFGPAFQAILQGIEMSRRPQGRHIHRAAAAIAYATKEVENWQRQNRARRPAHDPRHQPRALRHRIAARDWIGPTRRSPARPRREARLHAGRNRPAQEKSPFRQQERRGHL